MGGWRTWYSYDYLRDVEDLMAQEAAQGECGLVILTPGGNLLL